MRSWRPIPMPGRRRYGQTDITMGMSRMAERPTASAAASTRPPEASVPNRISCAGAAQTNSVEASAAPSGCPASRASEPTPRNENPTIQAGNAKAARSPTQ